MQQINGIIDVFGETASNIVNRDIFIAKKSSIEGRDKATLFKIVNIDNKFNEKKLALADEIDRISGLAGIGGQDLLDVLAICIRKEVSFIERNGDQPEGGF